MSIAKHPVFVVGIGSESGAPIPLPNKKLLKDSQQNIVVAKFSKEQPSELASKTSGSFSMLSVNDSDIEQALKYTPSKKQAETSLEQLSATKDYGYLLLFPALILMLMSFRKGWLIAIAWLATPVFTASLMTPSNVWASSAYESSVWDSVWQNQDQRAQAAYDQGHYNEAAELFSHPLRKGNAHAKAQNWESAETQYQSVDSSIGKYNLANIQAQQGKFDEALKSYDQAIEQATSEGNQKVLDQSKKDKAFLEQLKEQQQDQQNKDDQQGESNGEQGQNSDSEQNQSGKDSSDNNSSNQDGSEQQNKDASSDENSDQQNSDSSSNEQDQSDNQQNSQSQQNQGSSDQQGSGNSENDSEITEQQAEQAANRAEKADQALDQPTESQANAAQSANEPSDQSSDISDFSQANTGTPVEPSPDDIEEQKYQQILRKIQSDPSVLLENKFKIQHYQRNKPENEAQVW